MKEIFSYLSYKNYLRDLIASKPKGGRGIRIALARAVGCPVSHISQVLGGDFHLSPEQAEGANEFFGHTEEEAEFFLLLIQFERAGTPALKRRLQSQIDRVVKRRLDLKERLGVKSVLSEAQQATFYSSWLYGAVHVILSIEKFRTKEAIARYLNLTPKRAGEILEFLVSIGLAKRDEGEKFSIGPSRLHLGSDSPLISKFHTNWRMQAIRSFDREDFRDNLHYSSVVTLSDEDAVRIKALLVKSIEQAKTVIRDSKEEGIHCFAMDFFKI